MPSPPRPVHALDARTPRRCHVIVDRRRWVRTRVRQPRLLRTLLGHSRISRMHSGKHKPPRKGSRGRARRRVPPLTAHYGECRRGRRREAVRLVHVMMQNVRADIHSVWFPPVARVAQCTRAVLAFCRQLWLMDCSLMLVGIAVVPAHRASASCSFRLFLLSCTLIYLATTLRAHNGIVMEWSPASINRRMFLAGRCILR